MRKRLWRQYKALCLLVVAAIFATGTSTPLAVQAKSIADKTSLGNDQNLTLTFDTAANAQNSAIYSSVIPLFSDFPIPTLGSGPFGITAGPDSALWFTEYSSSKIGRITTEGQISEFSIPTSLTLYSVARPITTEPITTGPITTEPITTGPISTGPVSTGPVTAGPVSVGPITTGLICSSRVPLL